MSDGSGVFLFVGSAAYSNRGCEAIVRGTVEILSRTFPGSRYIISTSPEDIIDGQNESDSRIEHRVPADIGWGSAKRFTDPQWWKYRILLRPFREMTYRHVHSVQYNAMKECACALQVGGDNYTFDYGLPYWLLRLDEVLLSTGKPLVLWGASIGPFSQKPEVENAVRGHLTKFDLICARETETKAYLESLGVSKNVKLVGDPAFLMQPEEPMLSQELKEFISRRPIGLNLSNYVGRFRSSSASTKWEDVALECVKSLTDAHGPLLLVPHVFKETNDDHLFLSTLLNRLKFKNDRLAILPRTLSAAELKWVISKLRLMIGARTHSTIAALSSSVPTISIRYSIKAKGINKDIFGNEDWVIPVSDLSAEALLQRVQRLLSAEHQVRGELDEAIPIIQRNALNAGHYLVELLNT